MAKSWTKIGSKVFGVKTKYDDSDVNGAYLPVVVKVAFETIFLEHGYSNLDEVSSIGNPKE